MRTANGLIGCIGSCGEVFLSFNTSFREVTGYADNTMIDLDYRLDSDLINGTSLPIGLSLTVQAMRGFSVVSTQSVFLSTVLNDSFDIAGLFPGQLNIGSGGMLNITIKGLLDATLANTQAISLPSSIAVNASTIPEPSMYVLFLAGLAGLVALKRRRNS